MKHNRWQRIRELLEEAVELDAGEPIPAGMKALFAVHGILSLVMLVGLILLYLISTFEHKAGHPTWFQRHRAGTWSLVTLWLLSVGSGEFAFVWRYLV